MGKLKDVLVTLRGSHIQNNKFRLGLLGSQDIDSAVREIEELLREEGEPLADLISKQMDETRQEENHLKARLVEIANLPTSKRFFRVGDLNAVRKLLQAVEIIRAHCKREKS